MNFVHPSALNGVPIELKGDEGDPAEVVTKALNELRTSLDERVAKLETKSTERLDKIEARLNRPAVETKADEVTPERKAFGAYLRQGRERLTDIEIKTLQVSIDPNGGYFAPAEFQNEFIRDLVQFSPIRSLATVKSTGAPSMILPKRIGITNAKWKGELAASEASEPTFGQLEIPVKEINTHVDISNQLLQDASADVEGEVRLALAEDFGQKEGLAFVSGAGTLDPTGLLTNGDIAYTANTHATNLNADALITLMYALPAAYRNRGSWLMNGNTLAALRKLKDGQGNYLWQPAYTAGQPETILGHPVTEAVDMPDATANLFPIMFGDFKTAYRIIDRLSMSIMPNPYLLATNGITRFHAIRRVGANVVQPKALRKLKMAVS